MAARLGAFQRAVGMFFRDVQYSSTESVCVSLVLALDTPAHAPQLIAWELAGPPDESVQARRARADGAAADDDDDDDDGDYYYYLQLPYQLLNAQT